MKICVIHCCRISEMNKGHFKISLANIANGCNGAIFDIFDEKNTITSTPVVQVCPDT